MYQNVAWAEAYLRTKWHLNPSSRLATTDMGRNILEDYAPFWGWELGPHLTQRGHGRGLYLRAKFHLDPSNRLAAIHKCYRQDRQRDRQRSDSIGRTVFSAPPFQHSLSKNNGARAVSLTDRCRLS